MTSKFYVSFIAEYVASGAFLPTSCEADISQYVPMKKIPGKRHHLVQLAEFEISNDAGGANNG